MPSSATDLRSLLLPLLNQRSRLTSLQPPGLTAPFHRPFAGGLVVTYVVDQPETMAYVNPRLLVTVGAAWLGVEELQLGVPNRDFLIGFGDRDAQHVAAMARQVRRDATNMPRPLTSSLLMWQDGRLRELQPLH